jgi:hypothetical protein
MELKRFIFMFITAHHWSLFWARVMQSTSSQNVSEIYFNIIFLSPIMSLCRLYIGLYNLYVHIYIYIEGLVTWSLWTTVTVKLKLKQSHYTPWRRLGKRYSSYSLSTSALDGGEWSASRPSRPLAPGKVPPVPIVQEAEWAPELVWTQRLEKKSFCLCRGSNLDRPVVQSVTRHYTDWTTPAHTVTVLFFYVGTKNLTNFVL